MVIGDGSAALTTADSCASGSVVACQAEIKKKSSGTHSRSSMLDVLLLVQLL